MAIPYSRWVVTGAAILAATAPGATVAAADKPCRLAVFAELPVEMHHGQPHVRGSVNGRAGEFVADSGAFFSLLLREAVGRFAVRPEPLPIGMYIRGLGGEVTPQLGVAKEFDLTGLHGGPIRNVDFLIVNDFSLDADGLLGQNVLAVRDTEYDLGNGKIRLVSADHCGGRELAYWSHGADVGTMEIDRRTAQEPHIRGKARLNGAEIDVVFDTGTAMSMLRRHTAEKLGVHMNDAGVVAGGDQGGLGRRKYATWIAPFKSLDLGGETIQNIKLRVADADSTMGEDLLLGSDFFLSHRLYVANSQHRLYFTYNGGPVFDLERPRTTPEPTSAAPAAAADPAGADPAGDAPADAAGFLRRGTSSVARHEFAAAIADFDRAAALTPDDPEVYYQRALARWWNGAPILAMTDIDKALALSPGLGKAAYLRGDLRLSAKDKAGAIIDFDVALNDRTADSFLAVRVGGEFSRYGYFEDALPYFDRWIEAHPRDDRLAEALNGRCFTRARWGRGLDLALKDCDGALQRSPKAPHLLDTRGLVRLRLGDLDGAIADYRASIALQPKNAWTRFGLGLAYERKGQAAAASEQFREASALQASVEDDFRKIGLTAIH